MIPATTPTYVINLKDADGYLENTIKIRVDIRQQDIVVSKEMEDLIIDTENNAIILTLTQKESAKFLYKKGNLQFQVHGLLEDGITAWKTYVVATNIDKTLTKELLV